jgi:uncharacterized membrane protein YfhO
VREQRAEASTSGLVSVAVYEGDQAVRVYYVPPGFKAGAALSGVAWVLCIGFLLRRRRSREDRTAADVIPAARAAT